ncbi:replication protein P [Pseudomonas aeruginosa]|uniref:replication protein P n=2 Tax=Pseudomonas aeruginosa TaxID=287 RepID=UPI003D7FCC3D
MPSFQINDEEREALRGLPMLAREIYVFALRPFMDFATGIVGERRGISWKSIAEELYVEPHQGIKGGEPSEKELRRALVWLQKVGLVGPNLAERRLIFELPKASRDQSVRKKVGTKWADEAGSYVEGSEPSNYAAFPEKEGRYVGGGESEKVGTPPVSGNNRTAPNACVRECPADPATAGQWCQFFIRERGFQIHAVQTARTMPLFASWVERGVTAEQMLAAMEIAEAKLGAPPDSPCTTEIFSMNSCWSATGWQQHRMRSTAMNKPMDETPKHVSDPLHDVRATLLTSSTTTTGEPQIENLVELDAQARRAVKRVFATLKTSYPAWYEKHYGERRAETLAKRVWLTGIKHLSDMQVDRGLQRMVLDQDFPPSLKEFLRLCRKIDGLPSAEGAWYEALEQRYSHKVVKVAAELTGLFELRRAQYGDKRLRAEFEHNYAVVVRRLEAGEPLDGKVAKAIGLDSQKSELQRADELAEQQLLHRMQAQGLDGLSGAQARELLLAKMRRKAPEVRRDA